MLQSRVVPELPALPEAQLDTISADVWQSAEQDIFRIGYGGRVKQMLQFDGENGGKWITDMPARGWLTRARARRLEALDVPVRQLLWVAIMRKRPS